MDPNLNKAAEEGDVMYLASRIVRINRTEEQELALGIHRTNGLAEEENRCGRNEYMCLLNTTQEGRNNILHLAAKAGHDLFIALALQFLPALSNQVNSKGETPLLVAAKFGHLNVVGTIKNPKIKFQIRRDMAAATTTLIGTYSSGSSRHVEEELVDIPLELGTIHDNMAIGYSSSSHHQRDAEERIGMKRMDPELYEAAKKGDESCLSGITGRNITEDVAAGIQDGNFGKFLTRTYGNNILHIAARAGHKTFVAEALKRFPFLSDQVNREGDTPLIVAARFGHLEVVKALAEPAGRSRRQGDIEQGQIDNQLQRATSLDNGTNSRDMATTVEDATQSSSCQRDEGEGQVEKRMKNLKQKTTALHEALRNGHESVARYLFELDPEMATLVNGAEESPLYLAAESGCQIFMMDVLLLKPQCSTKGPQGQNALHAARHCDGPIIDELIHHNTTDLMRQRDNHGNTVIRYAIEGGYRHLLYRLLKADSSIALFPDSDGYTPLLRAASMGLPFFCGDILRMCPESIEARNDKGQHALHLADFKRSYSTGVRFAKIPELRELLNVSDDEGNTPLHLAVKENQYYKVLLLSSWAGVNLAAVNKEGHTSLDLCDSGWKLFNEKRMIWHSLRDIGAPSGRRLNEHKFPFGLPLSYISEDVDLKPFINTIILVATLISTVSFAAAFTIPGAFDQNSGSAILAKKAALQVFIVSDTMAMCCSTCVVFFLSMAMVSEQEVAWLFATLSWNLLKITLVASLVAFMSGVFAVISSKALWLSILVCVICSLAPFVILFPGRYYEIGVLRPCDWPNFLQMLLNANFQRRRLSKK